MNDVFAHSHQTSSMCLFDVGLKFLPRFERLTAGFAMVLPRATTDASFSTSADHYSYHTSISSVEFLKFAGRGPAKLGGFLFPY